MEISPSSAPARHPIPTRFLSSQISFVLSCSTATRWEEPLVAGGSSAAHEVKPPPPPRLLVELVEPPSQPSSQSHAPIASKVLHAPADSSQEEPAQHRRGPCRRREELVVELHPSCTSSMRRALQVRVVLAEQEAPTGDVEAATPRPSKRIPVLCTHLVGWSSFSPPWTAPDEDGEQRRTCAAQVSCNCLSSLQHRVCALVRLDL